MSVPLAPAWRDLVASLFADPLMAVDAIYRVGGLGSGVLVRVIVQAPDQVQQVLGARLQAETVLLEVQTADAPDLKAGDTLELVELDPATGLPVGPGELRRVQGEPKRDRLRLVWTVDTRPAAP